LTPSKEDLLARKRYEQQVSDVQNALEAVNDSYGTLGGVVIEDLAEHLVAAIYALELHDMENA
jgi:hypothetical protein